MLIIEEPLISIPQNILHTLLKIKVLKSVWRIFCGIDINGSSFNQICWSTFIFKSVLSSVGLNALRACFVHSLSLFFY